MRTEFTLTEKLKLFRSLDPLRPAIRPEGIGWYWNSRMTLYNGKLGAYDWKTGAIDLPEWSRTSVLDDNTMLPTICHELKHAEQHRRMGSLKYSFAQCRIWAELTVEKEAEQEEARVRKLLGLEACETNED